MSKPKASTLQQRFGFSDPELTTPKHDELMFWLDRYLDNHCPGESDTEWESITVINELDEHVSIDISASSLRVKLPPYPGVKLIKKTWEQTITNRGYTIGFCDMVAVYDIPRLIIRKRDGGFTQKQIEVRRTFYFEVKPSIPSLGELFRQIRMYQTYTDGKWFVVSPDDSFSDQLIKQGVGFIKVE